MPSAELFVRLLLPIVSITFSSLFAFFLLSLKALRAAQPCTCDIHILKYVRPLYLGLLGQKLIIVIFQASSSSHMRVFPHMYLFFAIICIDMT